MNVGQKQTAKGCLVLVIGLVALFAYGIYVELAATARGDHSSFSELFWLVWAKQPWVIFLVSVLLAAVTFYFLGHFTAAPEGFYARIRKGKWLGVVLLSGSQYVFPGIAAPNVSDMRTTDSVSRRDDAWRLGRGADRADIFLGQLHVVALVPDGVPFSPANSTVNSVAQGRAGVDVLWIAAGRVVTVMTDHHPCGYVAIDDFVRDSVGAPIRPVEPHLAVALRVPGPGPWPTRRDAASAVTSRPKPARIGYALLCHVGPPRAMWTWMLTASPGRQRPSFYGGVTTTVAS